MTPISLTKPGKQNITERADGQGPIHLACPFLRHYEQMKTEWKLNSTLPMFYIHGVGKCQIYISICSLHQHNKFIN
jgi:hypothetical protein